MNALEAQLEGKAKMHHDQLQRLEAQASVVRTECSSVDVEGSSAQEYVGLEYGAAAFGCVHCVALLGTTMAGAYSCSQRGLNVRGIFMFDGLAIFVPALMSM